MGSLPFIVPHESKICGILDLHKNLEHIYRTWIAFTYESTRKFLELEALRNSNGDVFEHVEFSNFPRFHEIFIENNLYPC